MQTLLKVMDVKVAFAVKHYKIVTVTLVVAEKEVLAMLRAVLLPILARNLNGGSLWVGVSKLRIIKNSLSPTRVTLA